MSTTEVAASSPSVDTELVAALQSQIESLQFYVKKLEDENAKLSSQLSDCCCNNKVRYHFREVLLSLGTYKIPNNDPNAAAVSMKLKPCIGKTRKKKSSLGMEYMNHHPKRYVALKLMYFGARFYGFASEAHSEPTIESEIFKALKKTRLLVGDKKESQYSRCGRTDKGVSSVGQVIALFLRSSIKENNGNNSLCDGEIDYVTVLNRVLPNDIRVLGWCPAPIDFSARFTCLSRDYKYLFWRENLNLKAMETAGCKLLGEHDFRNFCKMDAINVHNYKRIITSFEISPCSKRFEDNQLCTIKLRGSAFLWHQVRYMVAVLFMVGQGLEFPDVIDTLLDIERTPRKPQYSMASELPLILQACEFEGLEFICSSAAKQCLRLHFEDQWLNYQLQAAIFDEALHSSLPLTTYEKEQSSLENDNMLRKKGSHVPLLSRPTEPSYEERRAKLKSRTSSQVPIER